MGNDLDLALALLLDDDVVAEVVGAALDLDALLEELLEGGDVEDLVRGGLGGVDDELFFRVAHKVLGLATLPFFFRRIQVVEGEGGFVILVLGFV